MLGQNQECYGSCFSPSQALTGDIAALRIWSRALPQVCHQLLCLSCILVLHPSAALGTLV